ncbi:hypothetical protein F3Y22_tig00008262pilonHSYRG00007 [Hibiscus syriacus]|uniref:BSD domain-containing protein n=1 Tax=Hibiscus syriacus TaxID=106335 RepID=A0A6A3CA82_HIBSY|nr:hypothetical protein F3Y22_tig00008262pilonHSYRG00007 [Hibiscus syriacus]
MSWLARSIANSLKLDEDDDDYTNVASSPRTAPDPNPDQSSPDPNTPRGVKEDISELTKTPPSDEELMAGIRSDLSEIGGRFKTEFSKLSKNIAVSEFTKIASNFLQFGSEEESLERYENANVVGLTEEVVAFARDIAMHQETWLDFPVPDDDGFDDFDMSDAQEEHALAIERFAPRLAALRIDLCQGYMSEGCFWKIYFILLHPRLSKHDA